MIVTLAGTITAEAAVCAMSRGAVAPTDVPPIMDRPVPTALLPAVALQGLLAGSQSLKRDAKSCPARANQEKSRNHGG